MDPNTHSTTQSPGPSTHSSAGQPDGLAELVAELDALAAQDLGGLADPARAERVLQLRRLLDRLEGHWLAELAAVDARGAAGTDQGVPAPSTAGWLRARLRMGAGAASSAVRTARAVFGGPLPATGQALTSGAISPAQAGVLAAGTQHLPTHTAVAAEPVLLEAAGRLDPARLRRVVGHLQLVADPDGAEATAERQHVRRGLWLAATVDGMVAVDGLLEPEAGQIVLAALEPLARQANGQDDRSGGQRRADALAELARRALEGGRLPQTGGIRPQLTVVVDLASLQHHPGQAAVGGEVGGFGPLGPEACRRLACDGAVTRVLVTHQPTSPDHHHHDACGQGAAGPAGYGAAGPAGQGAAGPAGHSHPTAATIPPATPGWPTGSRPRWPGYPRSWAGPPASPWTWAAPPGSSPRPNAPPWPCATAAASLPTAPGPWPGVRPTICGTGWTAAPPIWPTWPCCAGPTTGPCTRGAGGWAEHPTGG